MKKLILAALALLLPAGALGQTMQSYATVPTVAALKAMTNRPQVVQVLADNPGIFNWSTTPCTAADDYYQVRPTSGSAGCYTRNIPTFGIPISPARPDTVEGYFALTTVASNTSVTFAGVGGNPTPNFTPADIGKLLYCTGIGLASRENRLITSITGVTNTTTVVLANAPTQSMTSISQRCTFGTDQTSSIQAAFDAGRDRNVGAYVQAGTYLVSSPLACLPPRKSNGQNTPGPMCNLDSGASIIAMAPMGAVLTYGSENVDYTGFLRQSIFGGGVVDGNFVANYAVDVPFYNVATRQNQTTKNALLAGVRWGSATAPAASGGSLDLNSGNVRDIYTVTVTNITNAATPVVTTQWAHGLATGRIVTLVGVSGMTQANSKFFKVTVTGATTFTLDNTNSTGWGAFTGTASVAMTMPSMRLPAFVSAITNANPGVVSTTMPHGFTSGTQIWLADMSGINLGGRYCAMGATATTFQIYQTNCTTPVNTTSLGTYGSYGSAVEYLAPETVEKGIYFENGIDADVISAQIQGTRIGIYANPLYAGYDSKIIKPHIYNYNEQGELLTGIILGGDNTVQSAQIDPAVRYAIQFVGPRNTVLGSRLTYIGPLVRYANYASFIRLEAGADVSVFGGGAKGDPTFPVLGQVSLNGAAYGNTPGFSSFGFGLDNVTLAQPDSSKGIFRVRGYAQPATVQAFGVGETTVYICDLLQGGAYFSTGGTPYTLNLNTLDPACNYRANPLRLQDNNVIFNNTMTYGGVTLSNSVTGTGSMVLSTSPNFTGGLSANGNGGLSVTKTVRDSAGTGACTLIFTFGLLTGGTC